MRVSCKMVALGILLAMVGLAHAATINVTTTRDELTRNAVCSLREAVLSANTDSAVGGCAAGSGRDTIVLASGQTYTLSLDATAGNEDRAAEDDLDISSDITIQGNGAMAERSTAVACTLDDVGAVGEFRIFDVHAGGNLTLQDLTVNNGCADGGSAPDRDGGGILNEGTVTITGSTFSQNLAFSGGGIFNEGTVTIANNTLSRNSAGFGGGIFNNGRVTIHNTRSLSE